MTKKRLTERHAERGVYKIKSKYDGSPNLNLLRFEHEDIENICFNKSNIRKSLYSGLKRKGWRTKLDFSYVNSFLHKYIGKEADWALSELLKLSNDELIKSKLREHYIFLTEDAEYNRPIFYIDECGLLQLRQDNEHAHTLFFT